MKKFYYKKDATVDKTPIILRLERRHTMDVDKNEKGEDRSHAASRTKSFSSANLIKEDPAITKARAREITKSLSEDILSKSYIQKSAKVITESDLSSSWLYKARKASMNSKDSPQKTFQPTGLSPVPLTDPKFKPIPVKSKTRSKKSQSCLCYLAIMMAISLCTIGVLATVTGILYNEMFSPTNITSVEALDLLIDASNWIPEPRSLNDNNLKTDELNFNNETIQQFLESTNSTLILSGNVSSRLYEDKSEGNIHTIGFQKSMHVTDLDELIDNQKLEIKFKDADTVIYEFNSNSSVKYTNSSEIEEFDSSENKTMKINEVLTYKDNSLPDEVSKKIKEPEKFETFTNFQPRSLNDILTDKKEQHPRNMILNVDELKENSVNSSSNVTSENDSIYKSQIKNKESEIFEIKGGSLELKSDEGVSKGSEIGSIIPESKVPIKEDLLSNGLNSFEIDKQESKTEIYETDSILTYKNTNTKSLAFQNEHDVESMLMVINETEEEPVNSISNRNGEIGPLLKISSSKPINPSSFGMKNSVNGPVDQSASHHSQEKMSIYEAQQMKPLDMKVSLAEAIKQLQMLDVNNTIPSSRMKSVKTKPQHTQQTKLNENPQNKQNITMEKIKYLQHLRLLWQQNLQRA